VNRKSKSKSREQKKRKKIIPFRSIASREAVSRKEQMLQARSVAREGGFSLFTVHCSLLTVRFYRSGRNRKQKKQMRQARSVAREGGF
jgi:hypothetical protein